MLDLENQMIASLRQRPVLKDPLVLVTARQEIVQGLRERSHRSATNAVAMARDELLHISARVRSLSPQATLDRGYAVVQLLDGVIARNPSTLHEGDKLRIRLALGDIGATVNQRGE